MATTTSPLDRLPEQQTLTLGGVAVAMLHDAGPARNRRDRMRRLFPDARIVVFGHSHIPLLDDDDALMLLNPGSPTDRRRMPTFTMASFVVEDGAVHEAQIIDLSLAR